MREPWNRTGFFGGEDGEPVFKGDLRPFTRQLAEQESIADGEFGSDVSGDAGGEFRGSVGVERNGQHAAQQAAVEGGDPLRAVFGPKEHTVAGLDAPLGQQRGKTASQARDLTVGGDAAAVALVADYGGLAAVAAEVVEKCSQMVAHGRSGKDHGTRCGLFGVGAIL